MSLLFLNFHGIGPIPREIIEEERICWLDLDFFEAVLDLVRDQPHVRLTIDDGNASDHDLILPALLRNGLRAMFFVCSGRMDQPTFLSQNQVRELLTHGMSIGSHGAAHVSWRRLPAAQLDDEIEGSKKKLEDICGVPIESAACPLGAYDRRVLQRLRRAGFRHVYTSDGGLCSEDQWIRARTTVIRSTSLSAIECLVQRGPGILQQTSIDARKLIKRLR